MTVKPKMIETADTSSSTVRPHLVQQQSRTYEEELPCNDESLLRFDLPWDMVNYKRVFKPNVDIEKFM